MDRLTLTCIYSVFTMSGMEFVWDASNIEHLRRHKITPQEAEEAIQIEALVQEIQDHPTEGRVLCFGRTAKGRLLTIVYTMRGDAVRVVTGYRMPKWQQRMYFQDK